jgi:arginase family enzyme
MHQVPPLFLDSIDVSGCGELAHGLKAKNCAQVGRGCKAIRDHTAEHCKPGTFPLILGGDHCISIGTISAIKKANKDTGVVWVSSCSQVALSHQRLFRA